MSHANHSAAKGLRLRLLEPLLHLGFALTGVGTVLLGSILPRLSAQWHLRDKDAGLLLLVQFATSASGALLVRRNLWKALALRLRADWRRSDQYFSAATKSLARVWRLWTRPWLGHDVDQHAHRPALSTAHGSCARLAQFFLERGRGGLPSAGRPISAPCRQQHRLWPWSGCWRFPFAPATAAGRPRRHASRRPDAGPAPTGMQRGDDHPLFCALAFLYVGIEASIGNWMSTYATRATAWTFAGSTLAVALFWAALLFGPSDHTSNFGLGAGTCSLSSVGVRHHSRRVIAAGGAPPAHHPRRIGSQRAGAGALVPAHSGAVPGEIGGSRNAGWVFAVAGLGGAVLSWLTGTISSGTGSLRIGLMVPGAQPVMLALISWRRTSGGAKQQAVLEPTATGKI